jgi:hypothetical protein
VYPLKNPGDQDPREDGDNYDSGEPAPPGSSVLAGG